MMQMLGDGALGFWFCGHTAILQTAAVPFYRELAKGRFFGTPPEKCYVLTTRNDGSITMTIDANKMLNRRSFDEAYRKTA
jgi:hypothetical protein